MALDTTIGGASSDSYGTLADYEAYVVANIDPNFNGHGHDSVHEMHLRRATQYLDRAYNWIGQPTTSTQALAWPRYTSELVNGFAVPADSIPPAIISAQFEIAYALETAGVNPFATLTEGATKRTRAKAGPVESETEYQSGRTLPRFVAVEGLVKRYTLGGPIGGGQIRMGRG